MATPPPILDLQKCLHICSVFCASLTIRIIKNVGKKHVKSHLYTENYAEYYASDNPALTLYLNTHMHTGANVIKITFMIYKLFQQIQIFIALWIYQKM